jgi:hypothetical protein
VTPEQQTLLIIKGTISDLHAEDKAKVTACAERMRAAIVEGGDFGPLGLALVGAEMAAADAPSMDAVF